MYCKHLSKSLNGRIKCKYYKRYIDYKADCKNCLERNLVANKPIKKVSKNRITVKKEIYQQVYDRDKGKCKLQNGSCEGGLELHHIVYRSEDKKLINEPTNCIMLCTFHHQLVHSNKKKYQPLLLKMLENK